ncbi:MAG: hexokinase [Clostridiales bacterium]|nr:hexokinase [Clostridiales bacterium]
MKNIKEEIKEFLYDIKMHPDLTDIKETAERFMDEMDKGLRGENSSLKMIPTYISADGTPPNDVPVIAIDAGGTNLRIGIIKFSEGIPRICRADKCAMPGTAGEVSSEEFFSVLADKVLPFADESDRIGFCFSYPAEISPDCDGKILCFTKEVRVKNAEGLAAGHELLKKLYEKGGKKELRVTLMNDTAACLMGGIAAFGLKNCDGAAGLILGTGNNSCYIEKGKNIVKLDNAKDMIINCESGNFSKAVRGVSDEITDLDSDNPGAYLFEKMLGGAYHGKVITNTVKLASQKGLLSKNFSGGFNDFTAQELDNFMRGYDNRVSQMCLDSDAQVLRELIDMSYERAAKLVCANAAALCLHCEGGKSKRQPFCVIAEGTSFYGSLLLKDKLDRYVKSCLEKELSRFVVFRRVENATLSGAAFAAFLN